MAINGKSELDNRQPEAGHWVYVNLIFPLYRNFIDCRKQVFACCSHVGQAAQL